MKDALACLIIFVAVFAMFPQMAIEGKLFTRGDDSESAASMNEFAVEEAAKGDYPLWCPYVFGGFPGLAAGAYSNYEHMGAPYALAYRYFSPRYWADVISQRVLFLGGVGDIHMSARWLLALFLYAGLLTYLLMRRLDFGPLIAFFSAILMAWNPYLISLATASHGGKMMTFIYMPLIILLTWQVIEQKRLLDFALLAAAFGWQIAVGGHTQVLFYSFVTVGIVYLVWLGMELKENFSLGAFTPALFIGLALILGFGVGALWYIPLFEFVGHSIRGIAPAFAQGTQPGYSIADATMWSFHPQEILTFIAPSWFGLKSPYYWGTMPFTSSSFYFGIVPLLFAVLAFFGKKDRLFWGLVGVTIFSLLLSFGQHFETFYRLFFDHLPFFNKFRTPSLIVLLVVLAAIVWAGYGLRFVLGLVDDEQWKKRFLIATAVCVALFILLLVAGGAFSGLLGSFSKVGEERQYNPQQIEQLRTVRWEMLRKDLMFSLFWLAASFAACWLYVSRKLKQTALLLALIALVVIDLWRFGHQFFAPQPAAETLAGLKPNKVVEALRADKSVYRVMPLGRLIQDNRWAAWEISSLGGYHGAKLRSYQDLLDNVFYKSANPALPLNLPFFAAMNCKYFVAEGQLPPEAGLELVTSDAQDKWVLYRNPKVLERAYFADTVEVISDREQALTRLMTPDFNWSNRAVLEKTLPGAVAFSGERKATVTEYGTRRVKITATTATPTLLVLSDAYYKPGWKATLDGSPTEIYRVNTYVRGIYLPPGNHALEFQYAGAAEQRGVLIATVSHFLVWGLVLGAWWWERRKRAQPMIAS
jgi:hypothetical protein